MKVIDRICRALMWFSCLTTFAMMVITVADVFCRYVLDYALVGATEIIQMLVTCCIASFAAAILDNRHVKIDMVIERFPKKVQRIIDICMLLLCLLLCAVLSWRHVAQALYTKDMRATYSMLKLPMWPFIMLFALSFGTGALAIVCKIIKLICGPAQEEMPKTQEEVTTHEC